MASKATYPQIFECLIVFLEFISEIAYYFMITMKTQHYIPTQ